MSEGTKTNESSRRCIQCGSTYTYTSITKEGKLYPHWYNDPYRESAWLCGKCFKNQRQHNKFPSKEEMIELRDQRMRKRICCDCNGTTTVQNVGKSSYHIWHKNPNIHGTWLCAVCYAKRYYAPKKKFKTKQERYRYLSKLFSGEGNPMFGDHTTNLCRTYTPERNKKVSEGGKKWILEHPDEHRKKAVLGALKARQLGIFKLQTKLEKYVENGLKMNNINYISQYSYSIGIMDFYLPKENIALFVDGSVWHADPRIYRAGDLLFFGRTAKQIWEKDLRQTNYLKSQGCTVLRFWEREIYEGIDNCLKIIIDSIQSRMKNYARVLYGK